MEVVACSQDLKGAEVGDLFMNLIHTRELNGVNPVSSLTERLRHADPCPKAHGSDALELPDDPLNDCNQSPPDCGRRCEAIKNIEGHGWNGEEIHGGDRFAMVVQERFPLSASMRFLRTTSHPARDGPLRNVKAKLQQLTVNVRRTPGGVLRQHSNNEFAYFPVDRIPASPVARTPKIGRASCRERVYVLV